MEQTVLNSKLDKGFNIFKKYEDNYFLKDDYRERKDYNLQEL